MARGEDGNLSGVVSHTEQQAKSLCHGLCSQSQFEIIMNRRLLLGCQPWSNTLIPLGALIVDSSSVSSTVICGKAGTVKSSADSQAMA